MTFKSETVVADQLVSMASEIEKNKFHHKIIRKTDGKEIVHAEVHYQ